MYQQILWWLSHPELCFPVKEQAESTINEEAETGRCPTCIPIFRFPGQEDHRAFPEKEYIRRWCLSAS
jgi:hypothetical protein